MFYGTLRLWDLRSSFRAWVVFLVFGLLKFVSNGPILGAVYPQFRGGLAVSTLVYALGAVQILGAVMLFIGWKTRLAASVLAVMHLATIAVSFPRIINPFAFPEGAPPNCLFFGGVPILAAMIALIFLGTGAWSVEGDSQSRSVRLDPTFDRKADLLVL